MNIDPDTTSAQTIGVEFIYSKNSDDPFFGTVTITKTGNIFDAVDANSQSLTSFLANNRNCQTAHCFMKLQLKNATQ